MNFQSTAHGKWILAGEHAVLRGHPALVFPVLSRAMTLDYERERERSEDLLSCDFEGESADILKPFFGALLNKALETTGRSPAELQGSLQITNQIPVGAGMGASAALCVNIARWFVSLGWLAEGDVFEFAKTLETVPHGESSGVDIATVMSAQGLRFQKNGPWQEIQPRWQPQWYLLHSGRQGITAKCVRQVGEWMEKNPEEGRATDEKMRSSVALAEKALSSNEEQGLSMLQEAIDLAHQCFATWQLIDSDMQEKMNWLREHGAIACKPVGSGGGGFLLGLWPRQALLEDSVRSSLISCNDS